MSAACPRNLTGKKLELPVKRILQGADVAAWCHARRWPTRQSLDEYLAVHRRRVAVRIAIIGTGVIGSSWAALFAAHGHTVAISDPDQAALDALPDSVEASWASLDRHGLVVDGARAPISSTAPLGRRRGRGQRVRTGERTGAARSQARAVREIDALAGPDVVIASSSSGLMPSDIQDASARHPERVLIGHPFNPPHLVPLVEVVGGRRTSNDAIERAMEIYRSMGKVPIHITAELPGHVTNRLQAALWREAYWLVEQGVVSVAEIDTAISNGPGLRWALLGPFADPAPVGWPRRPGARHRAPRAADGGLVGDHPHTDLG